MCVCTQTFVCVRERERERERQGESGGDKGHVSEHRIISLATGINKIQP